MRWALDRALTMYVRAVGTRSATTSNANPIAELRRDIAACKSRRAVSFGQGGEWDWRRIGHAKSMNCA